MKKLYITLIVLVLTVAAIVPAGVVIADPGVEVQEFLNQYNLAVNPDAKTTVANIALQQPGCVCQMAMTYASMSPAGAAFVAGPTGVAGTPVIISVGNGQYIITLM